MQNYGIYFKVEIKIEVKTIIQNVLNLNLNLNSISTTLNKLFLLPQKNENINELFVGREHFEELW